MSRPSVIARTLTEARQMLEAAGVQAIAVTYTSPPSGRVPAGPERVVRERMTLEGVELLVAASVPPPEGKDCHD